MRKELEEHGHLPPSHFGTHLISIRYKTRTGETYDSSVVRMYPHELRGQLKLMQKKIRAAIRSNKKYKSREYYE